MNGDHTYLAFLDLKKAYDSVPIYNILTKLYNMGIRGNTFTFLTNRMQLIMVTSQRLPSTSWYSLRLSTLTHPL